jgi:hypothetical protein
VSGGSESTTSGPPEWAVPFFQNFAQRAQQTADLPYQPYSGATVSQLNSYQTAGLDAAAARAMQGSPVTNAASGELQRTLSGGYLNGNPYLDGVVNKAQGDVIRNYNDVAKPALESAMVRSGSFGNSGLQQMQGAQQQQLQDSLGNISTQIRGTDYANERNRMQGAVGMAPSIANQDYTDAQALSASRRRLPEPGPGEPERQLPALPRSARLPQAAACDAGHGAGGELRPAGDRAGCEQDGRRARRRARGRATRRHGRRASRRGHWRRRRRGRGRQVMAGGAMPQQGTSGGLIGQQPSNPYMPQQPLYQNSGLARFGAGMTQYRPTPYQPAMFQPQALGPARQYQSGTPLGGVLGHLGVFQPGAAVGEGGSGGVGGFSGDSGLGPSVGLGGDAASVGSTGFGGQAAANAAAIGAADSSGSEGSGGGEGGGK